mgnify:CR=1 FL=1
MTEDDTGSTTKERTYRASLLERRRPVFDVIFGVVLPVVLLVPGLPAVLLRQDIFSRWPVGPGDNTVSTVPFFCVLLLITACALFAWLAKHERLGWMASIVAGLLLPGAFVSLAIGAAGILGLCVIGLFLFSPGLIWSSPLIFLAFGLVAWLPAVMGYIYLVNAWQAMHSGSKRSELQNVAGVAIGVALAVGLSVGASLVFDRFADKQLSDRPSTRVRSFILTGRGHRDWPNDFH